MKTRIVFTMFSTNTIVAMTRATLLPAEQADTDGQREYAEREGYPPCGSGAPPSRAMMPVTMPIAPLIQVMTAIRVTPPGRSPAIDTPFQRNAALGLRPAEQWAQGSGQPVRVARLTLAGCDSVLFIHRGWRLDLVGIDPSEHWPTMRGLAQAAEAGPWNRIWVYDHFHTTPEATEEATHEA